MTYHEWLSRHLCLSNLKSHLLGNAEKIGGTCRVHGQHSRGLSLLPGMNLKSRSVNGGSKQLICHCCVRPSHRVIFCFRSMWNSVSPYFWSPKKSWEVFSTVSSLFFGSEHSILINVLLLYKLTYVTPLYPQHSSSPALGAQVCRTLRDEYPFGSQVGWW